MLQVELRFIDTGTTSFRANSVDGQEVDGPIDGSSVQPAGGKHGKRRRSGSVDYREMLSTEDSCFLGDLRVLFGEIPHDPRRERRPPVSRTERATWPSVSMPSTSEASRSCAKRMSARCS